MWRATAGFSHPTFPHYVIILRLPIPSSYTHIPVNYVQDLPSSDVHMDPAAYEQQLAAAYCFHQVLQSASSVCACGSLQNGDDSLATRTACAAYMHAVQHALEANLEYLTEVRISLSPITSHTLHHSLLLAAPILLPKESASYALPWLS